jgi:DNA polymerase III subunit gamma/tau
MLDEKYEPKTFDEVIGQDNSIQVLKNHLEKGEDCPKVYLFVGETGVGKSTLSRIMANELGSQGSDIRKYNSANTNGIDTAREIGEIVRYKPLTNRVFILEEVHRTTSAFQDGMLEILQNPPKNNYFILTTTNPEKLLKQFRGRCTIINLDTIENICMYTYLKKIVKLEKRKVSDNVLKKIVKKCEGHVRDNIKLLEKIIDIEDENKALKIVNKTIVSQDNEVIINLCRALMKVDNWLEVKTIVKDIQEEPEAVRRAVLGYMNSVLMNAQYENDCKKAYKILLAFEKNYFDTGKVGLLMSCYRRYFK